MPLNPEEKNTSNEKLRHHDIGPAKPHDPIEEGIFRFTLMHMGNYLYGTKLTELPRPVCYPDFTSEVKSVQYPGLTYTVKTIAPLAPGALIQGVPFVSQSYQSIGFPVVDPRLPLSDEFKDLLDEIVEENKLDKETVLRQGLVFVSLAQKAKQAGFKLAIVDDDGTIIANVDGF